MPPIVVNKKSAQQSVPAANAVITGPNTTSNNNNDAKEKQKQQHRINTMLQHLPTASVDPKELKWNGWGYKDTSFLLNKQGRAHVTGKRYEILSGKVLPEFRGFFEKFGGLDVRYTSLSNPLDVDSVPRPKLNTEFMKGVEEFRCYKRLTFEAESRLFHAHGHTCQELFRLRWGTYTRVPDIVIWPGDHSHVERIVQLAHTHNVVIIPFGGGTSVTQAIEIPENEQRMVVSLDMHEMNRILWIDKENLMACFEAGCIGIHLDAVLAKHGFCVGHEPDSFEFSTVGGWVATRASGMKKNVYGNIEDLLVHVKAVTALGTINRSYMVPRCSNGPDLQQVILGSEGTYGIVTEAVLKIRPLPTVRKYGCAVFPDFETGVKFMHEVARQRLAPASIRLMDNVQFQFGQALKPESHSPIEMLGDFVKKVYLTKWKGFDPERLCAVTFLFESNSKDDVARHEQRLFDIATQFGGLNAGEENGMRGYLLTFVIAYLRDYAFDYCFLAESFETSVPWTNVSHLVTSVKDTIVRSCAEKGIAAKPFVCARVTQTYDTGACVYFYFGFVFRGLSDPVATYSEIEAEARDAVLAAGGSLSHHHGVGKLRKKWTAEVVSEPGAELLKKIKQSVDPKNIFANGNLISI